MYKQDWQNWVSSCLTPCDYSEMLAMMAISPVFNGNILKANLAIAWYMYKQDWQISEFMAHSLWLLWNAGNSGNFSSFSWQYSRRQGGNCLIYVVFIWPHKTNWQSSWLTPRDYSEKPMHFAGQFFYPPPPPMSKFLSTPLPWFYDRTNVSGNKGCILNLTLLYLISKKLGTSCNPG